MHQKLSHAEISNTYWPELFRSIRYLNEEFKIITFCILNAASSRAPSRAEVERKLGHVRDNTDGWWYYTNHEQIHYCRDFILRK